MPYDLGQRLLVGEVEYEVSAPAWSLVDDEGNELLMSEAQLDEEASEVSDSEEPAPEEDDLEVEDTADEVPVDLSKMDLKSMSAEQKSALKAKLKKEAGL